MKNKLIILSAIYGTKNKSKDVLDIIRTKIVNDKLNIVVSNEIFGDPDLYSVKDLNIEYKFNDKNLIKKTVKEGDVLFISDNQPELISALWKGKDITNLIGNKYLNNILVNEEFLDVFNSHGTLTIKYKLENKIIEKTGKYGENINLKPLIVEKNDDKLVIIYSYYQNEVNSMNLKYYISNEIKYRSNINYIIVINGFKCDIEIPRLPNVVVLKRKNKGYDFGAHCYALNYLDNKHQLYDYYIFMNCGVFGPLLTNKIQGHWSQVFIKKINKKVKLVGTSIVCLKKKHVNPGPNVEGFFFATDQIGLNVLKKDKFIFKIQENKTLVINRCEWGLSKCMFRNGYSIDCMIPEYQGVDWRDPCNYNRNNKQFPSRKKSLYGKSINPYDVIFHKWFWHRKKNVNTRLIKQLNKKNISLCLVAIFKNESEIIEEWIEHYLNEGCDKFFLIDNGSSDQYMDKLKKYKSKIDIIKDDTKYAQEKLYNKYFLEKVKKYNWVIVCDLDEFIYSRKHFKTIKDYLITVNDNISQVAIPWKIFGSNGYNTPEKKEPVSVKQHFTKRINYAKQTGFQGIASIDGKIKNGRCKCIIKSSNLVHLGIHYSQIKDKNQNIDSSNQMLSNLNAIPINEQILEKSYLHLNHYAIRSLDWFTRIKMSRGDAAHAVCDKVRNFNYFYGFDKVSNDIDDLELKNKIYK